MVSRLGEKRRVSTCYDFICVFWTTKGTNIMAGKGIHVIIVLFLFSLLAPGCATTQGIADDIIGKGRTLKKEVAFLPGANDSGFGGGDFQALADAQLKRFLSGRCDGVRVSDSGRIRKALEEIPGLSSGRIDNSSLGSLGRLYGLNAVLEQRIDDIEYVTGKRGIWGFRRPRMLARASFRIRAYDTETTAVLFDDTIVDEVELPEGLWKDAKNSGAYSTDIANPILSKIIPKAGKLICRRLAREPWKGYTAPGPDNTLIVLAGKDAGLAIGDVLEVFGTAEPIEGQGDQVYLVSGLKIGEIKIAKVQEDRADAVPVFGHDLEKSHCVKFKP
jgi:predicted small secreted protein